MAVGFGSSSSVNCSDEMLVYKSLPLVCVRSIKDGALIFCHVAREEDVSQDLVRSIVNRRLKFSDSSSSPGHYYSSDEWSGLIRLIK